ALHVLTTARHPTAHLSFSRIRPPRRSPLFPYTTLFRSVQRGDLHAYGKTRVVNERLHGVGGGSQCEHGAAPGQSVHQRRTGAHRSEEHTSELQSLRHLVCRLLLEKKKQTAPRETRDSLD